MQVIRIEHSFKQLILDQSWMGHGHRLSERPQASLHILETLGVEGT